MLRTLAFDLGASSGKFFVGGFDGEKIRLDELQGFENKIVRDGTDLYWDFPMIQDQCLDGIRRALARFPDIVSFAADSYCNDFCLVDVDDEMLSPMRAYRDPRTIRNEDAIYKVMSKEELYGVSGNQIAPFNTLMQLAAMRIEGEGALLRGADKLLFLPDLLTCFLTGVRGTDRTIASVTQMYDPFAKDWADAVFERFGIERRLFAPFADAGTFAGKMTAEVCESVGAAAPLRVAHAPGHDTAAAFMAAQVDEDTLIVSSGTWMLVGCETAGPVITDYGFRHNIANEGGIDGHHRLIRNLAGHWLLQEVRREFLSESPGDWNYGALAEEAAGLPPYRWFIDVDLPEFYGSGNMRENIRRRCMETCGSAPETPAEFTACVGAGLAFKVRWAMEKLETLTDRRFMRVNLIGGGSRDLYTAQLIADAAGLPVLCGPVHASSMGNILFQLIASGEIKDVKEGRKIIGNSAVFPRIEPCSQEEANRAYERFCELFGYSLL